ncbi:hypothetical protein K2173_024666 [Erythroxylum novogranatense]|uniref:Epidermal patterning factor-like protein n=1 Tax=Erythroxylum novogranatense TaxID=1862640 RepID=A0AAV8SW91_9ROSI|nr:hypothetical protein K2173_024666 [Erythroxylum novogranatense]
MGSRHCFFLLALHVLSLASATTRHFAANNDVGANPPGHIQESSQVSLVSKSVSQVGTKQGNKIMEKGVAGTSEAAYTRGFGKVGSSPPSCEHKCYGCTPCKAIQVPTTSKVHAHLGVNYANYEPEGWKCKCGPSFYSP